MIKHITKKQRQRQISSIPARHDKHDITRDTTLNTKKRNEYKKKKNIMSSSNSDPSKRRVERIKVMTSI